LQRWVQGIRNSGSTRATDNRTPEQNELIEPGRRNRQLEMEVDVSEQAAPAFARR
jgi:transposase